MYIDNKTQIICNKCNKNINGKIRYIGCQGFMCLDCCDRLYFKNDIIKYAEE